MNTTKTQTRRQSAVTALRNITGLAVALMWASTAVLAQSPWERAAANLETTFTVLGGLMFMFGEAGAKRQISGIVFGGGLALFAAQFLTWLF
jgi:hypothetical protein